MRIALNIFAEGITTTLYRMIFGSEALRLLMKDEIKEELKNAREKGEEGKKEGNKEGNKEGINNMAALTKMLLNENRMEDLRKCTKDVAYRNRLLQQMQGSFDSEA